MKDAMSVINEARKREVGEPEGRERKISLSPSPTRSTKELEWKEFLAGLINVRKKEKKERILRSLPFVKIIGGL